MLHTASPSIMSSLSESVNDDPVVDAFTQRRWLVELQYAQQRFVVSIETSEANTDKEAITIAHKRAKKAYPALGNLMQANCTADSDQERERLGVGFKEPRVVHLPVWRNAA